MSEKTIDQAKLNKFMNDGWSWRDYSDSGDGSDSEEDNVYVLEDETGAQYTAYMAEERVELTATANDLRIGTTALNDDGVLVGEKEIPSYVTSEGQKVISAGSAFILPLPNGKHEYTKLQAIFCPFNTSMSDSVSAEKVSIDGNVYAVKSTTPESIVKVVDDPATIDFGITNSSDISWLIRYFTYKEVF